MFWVMAFSTSLHSSSSSFSQRGACKSGGCGQGGGCVANGGGVGGEDNGIDPKLSLFDK